MFSTIGLWLKLRPEGLMELYSVALGWLEKRDRLEVSMEDREALSIEVEWNVNMDSMSVTRFQMGGGPEREFMFKARCRKCWGGLRGRTDASGAWTGIRCRICGTIFEREKAQAELNRMWQECSTNSMNLYMGFETNYADGAFVFKIWEPFGRLSEKELKERVSANRTMADTEAKGRWLTRNDFPVGAPALLFLQAQLLMEGVSRVPGPLEGVVDFDPVSFRGDGTMLVNIPVDEMKRDPDYRENSIRGNMGATMVGALTSAFSCELAMKAICLTCNDMAIKTHDLLDLFEDLPDECKGRIVADYPEISDVLEQSRQTFEKWRYFEVAVAEEALGTMINTDRSAKLAKAARVILDEAAAVGLQGVVNVNATRNGQVQGDRTLITDHLKVSVKGGECPPACS